MSAESVVDALDRWSALALSLGAESLQGFRPGLTQVGLDEIERKYQLPLPADVRALWGWRDGADRTANSGFGDLFPRLTSAIDWAALTLRIRRDGDADDIWGADREPSAATRWVTLKGGQTSTEIDVTDPGLGDCPVLIQDPTSPLDAFPRFTLAESIEGWILAVEIGYWYVEDGRWQYRPENYPSTPDRWRM